MKRIALPIISVMVVTGILFFSCGKENTPASNASSNPDNASPGARFENDPTFSEWFDENKDRLNDVTWQEIVSFMNNIELQKQIFIALSSETRATVWIQKMDYLVTLPEFSTQEIAYLNSVKSQITADLFVSSPAPGSANHTKLQAMRSDGEVIFPMERLFRILANLDFAGRQNSGGTDECSCSTTSDWCDFPVQVPGGHCSSFQCNSESSGGCGTLWTYSCDGDCTVGA